MIFVVMFISLIGWSIVVSTGGESASYSCSCGAYDDLCCVDGSSLCPGKCSCRTKGASAYEEDLFCSAGNEDSKLNDGAKYVSLVFLVILVLTICLASYYCCCNDDLSDLYDGSPPMCCGCLYITEVKEEQEGNANKGNGEENKDTRAEPNGGDDSKEGNGELDAASVEDDG